MVRCHGCWNFEWFCTCALDALDAELPTRCCACGNRWEFCPCNAPIVAYYSFEVTSVTPADYARERRSFQFRYGPFFRDDLDDGFDSGVS